MSKKALTCLALAVLAAGCGHKGEPVYPAQGQVLWRGRPATGAQVVLHPVGQSGAKAVRPSGQVDAEGRFTLTSFSAGDGAPPGDYHVTVELWKAPGNDLPAVNYLPPRLANKETSGLRATIGAGDNEIPALNITQ